MKGGGDESATGDDWDQRVETAIAHVFLPNNPHERVPNKTKICLPFVYTAQSLKTMGLVALRVGRRLRDGAPSLPVLLSGDTGTGTFCPMLSFFADPKPLLGELNSESGDCSPSVILTMAVPVTLFTFVSAGRVLARGIV